MSPSPDTRLRRFSRAERWVHWGVAILVLILIVSGACLFFPLLSGLVGNRDLFKWLHTAAGFLLPVPLILAAGSAAFRADLGRLNRFTPSDWAWFRRSQRESGTLAVGKFNGGQKLAAAVTAGALLVLFGTGMIMYFAGVFSDDLQTGATFVHDWVSMALSILLAFHISKGLADTEALNGMMAGDVAESWAMAHHPQWVAEMTGAESQSESEDPATR